MSNHWDLRCLTCGEDCELGWNHGGDTIQELIGHLDVLAKVRPALEVIDRFDYNLTIPYGVLVFAEQHHDHDLIAVDEYGDLYGACGKVYPCACCGHRQHCAKPRGHEGDCGPVVEGGAS